MIHVSYINCQNATITLDFTTNVDLNAWLKKVRSPFGNLQCIFIRFKDGHNVEFFREGFQAWKLTYAE